MALHIRLFSLHQIVIGIGASLIFFYIGNAIGREPGDDVKRLFFPDRFGDDED